jgi:hypothetical protein
MTKLEASLPAEKAIEPKAIEPQAIEPKAEFVLGAIKSTVFRVDLVRQELVNAALALKAGYVTAQQELDWAEEFAPGCVGYLPPLSGLGIKRDGGA